MPSPPPSTSVPELSYTPPATLEKNKAGDIILRRKPLLLLKPKVYTHNNNTWLPSSRAVPLLYVCCFFGGFFLQTTTLQFGQGCAWYPANIQMYSLVTCQSTVKFSVSAANGGASKTIEWDALEKLRRLTKKFAEYQKSELKVRHWRWLCPFLPPSIPPS